MAIGTKVTIDFLSLRFSKGEVEALVRSEATAHAARQCEAGQDSVNAKLQPMVEAYPDGSMTVHVPLGPKFSTMTQRGQV